MVQRFSRMLCNRVVACLRLIVYRITLSKDSFHQTPCLMRKVETASPKTNGAPPASIVNVMEEQPPVSIDVTGADYVLKLLLGSKHSQSV